MTKETTITTAFYNSERHLPNYLSCLLNLDYPKECLNLLWADNGSIDKTKGLLSDFLKKHGKEYNSFKLLDAPRLSQTDKKDFHIANIMNALFKHAETNIINIDSDICAPSDSIRKLLFMNKVHNANICGGITAFLILQKGVLVPVLNAFMFDWKSRECFGNVAQYYRKQNGSVHVPFVKIEVDSCGFALCFIEKRILRQLRCRVYSGDEFFHKCEVFPCVDIQFCLDAKLLGFTVMVDTSLFFKHSTLSYEVDIHRECIEIRSSAWTKKKNTRGNKDKNLCA